MKQTTILAFTHGRTSRKNMATETQNAIKEGWYTANGVRHNIEQNTKDAKLNAKYYSPASLLSSWSHSTSPTSQVTDISILEISTLQGARFLATTRQPQEKIGILNFASAMNPGGGWLSGAQAQEESIARASNLVETLTTHSSRQFYTLHNQNTKDPKHGLYSHAMIYSPHILLFRDDEGRWTDPLEVDVLTSAAVNAGVLRASHGDPEGLEELIESQMKERMARILFLFESRGTQNLVLGSFGTGVFKNSVEMVARIWADLLAVPNARFKTSFARIVFAIIGKETFTKFSEIFQQAQHQT